MKHTIDALKRLCEWGVESNTECSEGFATILDRVDWKGGPRFTQKPKTFPVVDKYFKQCVELAGDNPLGDLGRAALRDGDKLEWFTMYQSYKDDKRLKGLFKSYAILRLTGPKAEWFSHDLTTAISIKGPNVWYPPHAHRQKEIYGIIGGKADWQRGAEPIVSRDTGEVFYHSSGMRHASWTHDEPLLCFANWIDHTHLAPVFVWE